MITIQEKTPKKIPGTTSLFITFEYNQHIIDVIKTCDCYYYHKKQVCWEVPTSNLAYLLDLLILIDDVDLLFIKDKIPTHLTYKPKNEKIPLLEHQIEGVTFGLNHPCWLLLDEPGLGKTAQIIKLAEELKSRENIEHCLIICGLNSLRLNWKKEIEKFSDLTCRVVGSRINSKGRRVNTTILKCVEELYQPIEEFFIIINIEKLRDKELVKALTSGVNKIGLIAFDEAHAAKSTKAKQTDGLLKTDAEHKVAMTGTLILNNPLDTYVPLQWLGIDKSLLGKFKDYYCNFDGDQIIGYKNLKYLKAQIDSISLRRTKDILDLPPKNVIDEFVEMDNRQRTFYDNVRKGVKEEVDKVVLRTSNLLAMVGRLRQATECPQLLTTENIESAKVERCVDLVEQILSNPKDKVVIFSVFKEPLCVLNKRLSQYKPLLCTGDYQDAAVSDNITKFQGDDENRVLLGTVGKVGTGVTLNRARYAIFLSTPWTNGVQVQAEDRIHRVNNTAPVFIYRLWTSDTIDERVLELIKEKGAIADYIIDDKITEQGLSVLRKYIMEGL